MSGRVYRSYPILPFGIVACTFLPTTSLEIAVYLDASRLDIFPHHYSPPLRGTVVYYSSYPPSFHGLVFKSDGVGVGVVITIKRRTLRSSENSVLILLIPLTTPSFTIN